MANIFNNISDKKEEKKTKTKQSNLSSKITINKNTSSKSIQENLNKSSVTDPLSNSTQGSKVKVNNTKLSANTKNAKTNTSKVSNSKASNVKVNVNNIKSSNTKTNNTKSNTSSNKMDFFEKYFTAEGVATLDDNSIWKKISQGMDKSNSGNNLMSLNSNNIGSGLSQETKQIRTEVENREATEKLLNGEKSSKLGNYFNVDKGYQLDEEDKEAIDSIGVIVDNRTGKKVDNDYINKLYSDVDNKYSSINKQIEALNQDYQSGKLSDDDYKLKYSILENQWKDNNKSAEELKNYKYKSGKDYYEWLKENGTDEEIKSYEAYIGSYDDSMLDSLANSYKATLVDFANTPIEAVEMIRTIIDGDYDFSDDNTLSSNMRYISNELRQYTLNGKNGEGLQKYTLQTISSLMPMINDAIIFTVTGGALGWQGGALEKGVSLLTNLQFGLSSAGEVTRQRLNEGNSMEVAMANGTVHGVITGLVEALNVGNVTNVLNLLTGAGGSVLGVGLLSMPNAINTIASNLKNGLGESVEEVAEAYSDKLADTVTNKILEALGSDEQVVVTDTTWGGVGDEGLTDQSIMAFAGAILLGVPTTISTYIDSKAKYNAAIESKKYWQAAQDYFAKSGDTKNAQDCQSIISLIDQETRTYAINNEKSFAYEKASDIATPAPSLEDVMNMTANAFSLDVADTIEQAENSKATAVGIFNQLQKELVNRGMYSINQMGTDTKGVDVETYVKMTPELRTKAKNLLTLANELGANYKIDNEFNIYKDGKLTTMTLTDTQNGAHIGKGITDTVITNPFANDVKNNSNILEETLSHEFVHTAKDSGNYKNLENAVVKALGSEFESFKESIKNLYGDKVHSEEELMDEVIAKWVEKNLGSEKFIQQLSNYNSSLFSRLYTGMKALLNIDGKSEVANEFFKSYKDIIDKAKKGTAQTFIGGHAVSENGIAFNLSEFDKTGRDILKQYLIDNREGVDASNVENDPLYKSINSYYEMLKEMAESGDFPSFEQWSNWDIEIDEEEKPYFSCIVNNGEYKLNIDFSTVCKKRKVMDAVLNDLATKGILDNRALTKEEIEHLRQIIKDNGLEVSCKLCFVDAKRYSQGSWADTFINGKDVVTGKGKNKTIEHTEGWNELVERLIPEGAEAEEFNFANRDIEKTDSVKLHELSNSEVNQDGLQHLLEIMANTKSNTEIHRIAKVLYNKPNLRKKLELGDLYASTAFMNIKAGDKDFYRLVNGHQGSAKPKIPFLEVRYDNEILEGHVNVDGQRIRFDPDAARKVGGIRLQSFSDFMINTIFDYMEAFAQMDAKGLTAHSYTKVEDYVRLFGLTGMKINMSIIPKVADISDDLKTFIKEKLTQKDTGSLKPESSLSKRVKNDPLYQEYLKAKSTAGLGIMSIEEYNSMDAKYAVIKKGKKGAINFYDDKSMAEQQASKLGKDYHVETYDKARLEKENSLKLSKDGTHYSYYLFDDESFDWLVAKEIQETEGYDANCGTICVGVSDEHIWKLLEDPDVKMVIPYHKSSLNPVIAQVMNIGLYNDYTTKQNTRYANGSKLEPKDNTFDFYGDETYGMIATGYDVQKTTEGYLRWCSENNYLPKFDTFAYVKQNGGGWTINEDGTANYVGIGKGDFAINQNYYKTLIDFRAYDSKGNLAPQQEVKLNMPKDFSSIVKNGLNEHEVALGKQSDAYPRIEQQFESYLENNDIQYSLEDTQGRKLTDSQKQYFKNSKVVDDNGNLKVMYHGTSDSNFTIFDPSYSDDGRSLFFTDNPEVASTYSGLDIGKEYQMNYNPPILNNEEDANNYLKEIGLQLDIDQANNNDIDNSYSVKFDENDGTYHIIRTGVDEEGIKPWAKEDITDDLIKRAMVERKAYTVGKGSLQEVKDTFTSLDTVINAIRNEIWMEEKGHYETYLNLENPLIIDAENEHWNKLPSSMPTELAKQKFNNFETVDDLNALLKYFGVDEKYKFSKEMSARNEAEQELLDRIKNGEEIDTRNLPKELLEAFANFDDMVFGGLSASNRYYLYDAERNQWNKVTLSNNEDSRSRSVANLLEFYGLISNEQGNSLYESATNRKYAHTRDWSEYAFNNGYDGVIFKNLYDTGAYGNFGTPESTVAIAFDSSQVKSVKNMTPTSDPDIRYSLGQEFDSNGKELTEGQKEYFKDSKVRGTDGDLLVMYHGTDNAGFTVFDPEFSDDKISLFFTDEPLVANSYSGVTEQDVEVKQKYHPFMDDDYDDVGLNDFLIQSGFQYDGTNPDYDGKSFRVKFDDDNGWHIYRSKVTNGVQSKEVEITKDVVDSINRTSKYDDAVDMVYTPDEVLEAIYKRMGIKKYNANYEVYLNIENPLVIDTNGHNWADLPYDIPSELTQKFNNFETANDINDLLQYFGKDEYEVSKTTPNVLTDAERSAWERWESGDRSLTAEEKEDMVVARNKLREPSKNQYYLYKDGEYINDINLDGENINFVDVRDTRNFQDRGYVLASNLIYNNVISEEEGKQLYHAVQNPSGRHSNHGADTREWTQYAKDNGYDGVIFEMIKDVGVLGNWWATPHAKVVVAFDSNQVKSTTNLSPSTDSDIRYSMSNEEIERGNKWVERTQKVLDDINKNENVELTIDDIDDIIQQKQPNPRTLQMIEKVKKEMRNEVDKWVKGYETIRNEYPMFSEDTFKDAVFELTVYGELSEQTYNVMVNTLSAMFLFEGTNGNIKQSINEFINESLETFKNEAKYQAGDYDKESLKKSIKVNNAYESQTIDKIYQEAKEGSNLDRMSAKIKKDLQAYWQPLVDLAVKRDMGLRETKGKRLDSNITYWGTIDQNIFNFAHGYKDLYDMAKKKIRYELLDDAATKMSEVRAKAQDINNKMIELGIVEGSKESMGLQYFMEGHTEKKRTDIDLNQKQWLTQEIIDEYKKNPYQKYTLEDLSKDFNYKMANGEYAYKNILKAAEILRSEFDYWISEVNESQIIANGDIEGHAETEIAEKLAELNKSKLALDNVLAEIKKDGSKESTQAAFETLKRKYNKVLKEYNTLISKNSSHDLTRRNLTPYRENYVHHVIKTNLIKDVKSVLNAESKVPTELSGISDFTSPNTVWSSFSMAQEGGEYTPDAIASYTAYMDEVARVLAYNPVILSVRQLNKDIKAATKGTSLTKLSEYLNDYANMLAGKRDGIDRGVQKYVGEKGMALIRKLNTYAKGAAVVGSFKTGLTQFANIPTGISVLQSNGGKDYATDIGKGMVDYIKSLKANGSTAIDSSAYITNRYFDFDTGRTGFKQTVKNATDWLMTIGDKVGAEIIWWSAYEQGQRRYADTGIDPIQYADDIARTATASRSKEDMALTMQSQVVNLLLPFQVENNNLYQVLKQQGVSKQIGAIATYNIAAFLFNMIIKGIIGNDDEVLPELLTPIYKEGKKLCEGEQDTDTTVENIFFAEIAEFLSLLPWGSTVVQLIFGDDSDTVFGDYDPNRYGQSKLGASGFGNLIRDMKKHKDDPAQQLLDVVDNLVEGYVKGGKQIMRTTEGLQSMGGLPDYKGGKIQLSPVNYTSSGNNIAYVNDQENTADWVRAILFGKWNTSEAQEYLNNDYDYLSKSEMNVFDTLQSNSEGNDYQNYLTAKDYNNKEKKSSKDDKEETETEEKTLREELLEQGKYGSYKDTVVNAYEDYLKFWYKEEHEEDDEPKSFVQFANGYGLTSDDLKQDTYGAFYDTYKVSEEAQKTFSEALEIENSKNALNKTIANSGATQRRVIYEQLGIYEQILDFIENNGLEYSDFGLTKTVVGFDQDDINKMLAKINGESYEGDSSSDGSKKGSSEGSSSLTTKQKKAMKSYMSALTSNSNIFSNLENMTTIEDAKKNVEEILKDAYKG